MSESLVEFLERHPAHSEYEETWPLEPNARFRVRLCRATVCPPSEVRSSILAIVVRNENEVLFVHPHKPSGGIAHLLIGGRPELGETPEQTLIREVAEESGWLVRPHRIVGFRHLHHLGPRHAMLADRPYPDMLQPIYAATAERYDVRLLHPGEPPCEFVNAGWAEQVTRPDDCPLLLAALELARSSTSP
jgi:8-oxo-dGTP pyrophosphatase MutT (NUDIX family)